MASWKKGQSGNPNGRPKVNIDFQELAKKAAPDAIAILIDIAKHSTNDSARVNAANSIIDRAYGKPHQTLEATVHNIDPATISDNELATLIATTSKIDSGDSSRRVAETESDKTKLN